MLSTPFSPNYLNLKPTIKILFLLNNSVSAKGEKFLNSARQDCHPPLVLPLTSEMVGENGDGSTLSEAGRMENLATLKSGLSEVCMFEGLFHAYSCLVYVYYLSASCCQMW